MVTHIVLWNFLEPLKDVIPGVVSLKVVINELGSSNRACLDY